MKYLLRLSIILSMSVVIARAQSQCVAPDSALATFIHQGFVHGVQYSDASKFGTDEDVDHLVCMLRDKQEEFYHRNIVVVLGIAGNPRATEPLISFIESGNGILTRNGYSARSAALMSLGYLAAVDSRAMSYLQSSAEPEKWTLREIKWSAPGQSDSEDGFAQRNDDLARHAILGLGLSGDPSAVTFLSQLSKKEAVQTRANFRIVIAQALQTNNEVQKFGIAAYSARP
jgi:HEAT repeat protein